MKKTRLNKKKVAFAIILLIVVVAIIVTLVTCSIKYIIYLGSDEYKLKEIGYSEEQITTILKYATDNELEKIKNEKYEKQLTTFIEQKYFIYDKLADYIEYYNQDKTVDVSKVISIINVGADKDFYQDPKKTDTSLKELMLVNKFNYLDKTYVPENIVDVSVQYAYDDNEVPEFVYEKYLEMWNDANEDGLTLIMSSSYRDYQYQEELYNNYKNQNGTEWADSVAARAGYSEHQTGYALDIVTYNSTMEDFENSDEFKWLNENAYKYGFILRYPKDKEDITGYAYESWHYRYVGVEVASYIHENDITFDEYYAYFIENKQE